MTDTEAPEQASEDEAAPEPDAARDDLLAGIRAALGEAVVADEVVAHRDLWVRVDRDAWQAAGRALKDLGLTYFGFLSVIDWMDAPDGRYESTELDDAELVATVVAVDDDEPVATAVAVDDAEPVATAVAVDDDGSREQALGTGAIERRAGGETRFQVFARLQKPGTALGVTLKTDLPDDDLRLDSWVDVFAGANWHEREAHEMFGVDFTGHPSLRHIYLPTEFEGHPLRKDYPLLARVVKPWPGVVDIEEIPEHLEQQLEDEVMAAFAAEQGEAAGGGAAEQGEAAGGGAAEQGEEA